MHSEFGSKWFDCWKMKKDESFVKIVKLQKYSYIDRIEDVEKNWNGLDLLGIFGLLYCSFLYFTTYIFISTKNIIWCDLMYKNKNPTFNKNSSWGEAQDLYCFFSSLSAMVPHISYTM